MVDIDETGFGICPSIFSDAQIQELIYSLQLTDHSGSRMRQGAVFAARNLLQLPAIRSLVQTPEIRRLVEPILGKNSFAVRGILFDKTPGANWKVVWHQDISIAVKEKIDTAGFGPWSQKAGVQHVQPTVPILEQMVSVRIHLDECHHNNGPLKVLSGSHRHGKLSAAEITRWRNEVEETICVVPRGGVLLMKPLLLHASSPAVSPEHRRVIHLDFAATRLPNGLKWHEDYPLYSAELQS